MLFKIGDYVTRKSHDHDTVFQIIAIEEEIAYLKGVNIRLYADSELSDLTKVEEPKELWKDDRELLMGMRELIHLDRDEFFYLPGKVLHLDADRDYLNRCLKFYKEMNIRAFGVTLKEDEMKDAVSKYLIDLKPDVLVITGHDAYYKKSGDSKDIKNYRNSQKFVETIQEARKYEKSQDKLIVIAGACQSDYEELIKAGANFASSPKRINIHALDPAIIATSVALSDRNQTIDLINILEKTKYGSDGIGGIMTNGCMYVGYPR